MNTALKVEGFDSSLKLPDKVLTFVRDHPLMENSVTAAPLLVRKGISYTRLAVNQRGSSVDPRQVVLHLGTGEERRRRSDEWRGKKEMKDSFFIQCELYCST